MEPRLQLAIAPSVSPATGRGFGRPPSTRRITHGLQPFFISTSPTCTAAQGRDCGLASVYEALEAAIGAPSAPSRAIRAMRTCRCCSRCARFTDTGSPARTAALDAAVTALAARQLVGALLAAPGDDEWSNGWDRCHEAMLRGNVFPPEGRQPVRHVRLPWN